MVQLRGGFAKHLAEYITVAFELLAQPVGVEAMHPMRMGVELNVQAPFVSIAYLPWLHEHEDPAGFQVIEVDAEQIGDPEGFGPPGCCCGLGQDPGGDCA